MSATHDESAGNLLPHQVAFVSSVLREGGKRVTVLRADVGLGKSAALVALASQLLSRQRSARVLFIVPRALVTQFGDHLRVAGAPAQFVDRYRYREMLDTSEQHESLWPEGVVIIMSRDFAMQPASERN